MPDRVRVTSLDGLRGLAAAVVVIHHAFLVSPVLGAEHSSPAPWSDGSRWTWWAQSTPLHLVWNGGAAVLVFFVLSGFVLTLPFTGSERRTTWREYFPRRLIRLYVPVWGALAFAVLMILLVPRDGQAAYSWWVNRHDVTLAAKPLAANMILIRGTGWYNSPLWSLQYEVLFSLILPLAIWLVVLLRRLWLPVILLSLATVHLGASHGVDTAKYLPIFVIGVVFAVRRDLLDRVALRTPSVLWIVILCGSGLLLSGTYLPVAPATSFTMTVAGGSLMVLMFYAWPVAQRFGDRGFAQWLGRRSFSLYLTHEPVIVSIAFVTGWTDPLSVIAVSLPLAILVSAVFYRLVESPSHRWARAVGRFFAPRRKRTPHRPGEDHTARRT